MANLALDTIFKVIAHLIISVSLSLFRYSTENRLQLFKIKSEPNISDKTKLAKMYDWERDVVTVIADNDHSYGTEDCRSAKDNSFDSSISDHWLSIVGRVNDEPLLEDEAVPIIKSCESTPESKNFASFDNTLLEPEPAWRKVSDESFLKMEQMVMSPVRRTDVVLEKKIIDFLDESNLIVFSPVAKQNNSDKETDVSKSKDSDAETQSEKYETCDSYDSNAEVKQENACYNTLEELPDNFTDSLENPKSQMVENSICSSLNTGVDGSLNFNDTLEEMEYLIKYGMNYRESKQEVSDISIKEDVYQNEKSLLPLEPISKRATAQSNKENRFKLRSPRFVPPIGAAESSEPFKFPKKTSRSFFYPPASQTSKVTPSKPTPSKLTPSKLTPHKLTPSKCTPSKYDNILSPVQYYINNSPVVPKFKTVSPGINLWEKQAKRAASTGQNIPIRKQETLPLQEKAYKSSRTTKLIDKSPQNRLPNNFKVGLMADSLPKPTVIKHERREMFGGPLREQNCAEESFAHLALTTGDISLCVKKPALRTHTLK